MMKYHTNAAMREQILKTASRFFYDSGYEKTTIGAIAEACNTSKGLVTYYFKSKAELGYEIFENNRYDMIQKINQKIALHMPAASVESLPATYDRIILRQMHRDPRVFDFFRHMTYAAPQDDSNEYAMSMSQISSPAYAIGKHDPHFSKLAAVSARGAAATTIIAYFLGNSFTDIPYEEFENYRVSIRYRLMQFPEEDIRRIQENSRKTADALPIEYLPYFEIR